MSASGWLRLGLLVVAFIEGYLSMGLQLVASRLLSPFFGSSLLVWTFLISTFLTAYSVGALTGGVLSERVRRNYRLAIPIGLLGCGGFLFTALAGRPLLVALEPQVESLVLGLAIFCPLLFLVPVACLSCALPILTHLNSRFDGAGLSSGLVYSTSTIGNICGVMLTAFFLIPNFGSSTLLKFWFVSSVVFFGAFYGMAYYTWRRARDDGDLLST